MISAPGTSAPCLRPRPSSGAIRRTAAAPVAMPIGTLTKKIQCQLIDSVSTPPASSPTEPPAEATNAYTPIALACIRGSGNIVTIMPRMTADVIAPPMPWAKRAPTSISWLRALPHRSDATVNSVRPARKTVRRPIRSPKRPASSSSPPNAIRYALTTQARLEPENPRSSWIEGSATFTMVTSSTIISMPTHSTYSASQRERSSCVWGVIPLRRTRRRVFDMTFVSISPRPLRPRCEGARTAGATSRGAPR